MDKQRLTPVSLAKELSDGYVGDISEAIIDRCGYPQVNLVYGSVGATIELEVEDQVLFPLLSAIGTNWYEHGYYGY